MARLGYIRCQRKQEIEEFEQQAQADKVFIDLADEYGVTLGNSLEVMLDQLSFEDQVIIRYLHETADTVSELRLFLTTLKEKSAELVLLNQVRKSILSEDGYQTISYIDDFIKEKEKLNRGRQSKMGREGNLGRKVKQYPPNFLDVYVRYRNKESQNSEEMKKLTVTEAAKELKISINKFRELIIKFELRI